MCEPTTYKRWKEHDYLIKGVLGKLRVKPEKAIRDSANWLIQRLYEPDTEIGSVISDGWLETLGLLHLKNEAINWGDLGVYEVRRDGKTWVVGIEEASPEAAGLCAYIQGWLAQWGWGVVEVRTEW